MQAILEPSERHYSLLRSWYLARLKQEASGLQATPAAVIEFDKAFLEKVVAASKNAEPATSADLRLRLSPALAAVFVILNVLAFTSLFISNHGELGASVSSYFNLLWSRFAFTERADDAADSAYSTVALLLFFGAPLCLCLTLPASTLFSAKRRGVNNSK